MFQAVKIFKDGTIEELSQDAVSGIPSSEDSSVYWIDLLKPSPEEFDSVIKTFHFHPLAVEDCVSTERNRPTLYEYDNHYFIIFHAIVRGISEEQELHTEEINFFIGKNYIVTHHLEPIKPIFQTRSHLGELAQRLKDYGPSTLLHDVLDRIVDRYSLVLQNVQDKIDSLEATASTVKAKDFLEHLITVRESLMKLRRQTLHQQVVILRLQKEGARQLVHPKLRPYFSDIYDTLVHMWDIIESEKDNLTGLRETYLSIVSTRLNETMKVLTAIATVFMPMVIVTGIYGMNFRHMPELDWRWGYPFALVIMAGLGLFTYLYLRWKKWV